MAFGILHLLLAHPQELSSALNIYTFFPCPRSSYPWSWARPKTLTLALAHDLLLKPSLNSSCQGPWTC